MHLIYAFPFFVCQGDGNAKLCDSKCGQLLDHLNAFPIEFLEDISAHVYPHPYKLQSEIVHEYDGLSRVPDGKREAAGIVSLVNLCTHVSSPPLQRTGLHLSNASSELSKYKLLKFFVPPQFFRACYSPVSRQFSGAEYKTSHLT